MQPTTPRAQPPWLRQYAPQLIALVVGLLVVFVVRSCSDDDAATPPTATFGTAAPETGAADSTTTTVVGPATDPSLAPFVVQAGDLPAGWARADRSAVDQELCKGHDPLRSVKPSAAHQVTFARSRSGPFLTSVVAEYGDDSGAEDFVDAAEEAIEACARYEADGLAYRVTVQDVDGLGEGGVAARITGSGEAGTVEGWVLYARVGRRVATVVELGVGRLGANDVARDAIGAVLDRLEAD